MIIVRIGGKVNDMGFIYLLKQEGGYTTEIAAMDDGYMPNIPYLAGGDYIEIDIDNETGVVVGWKPLTLEDLGDE